MHPKGRRKCLYCHALFVADARNRHHQRYCPKPDCRRASKAASQQRWRSRPGNRDYFRGAANVQRVREWRAGHPGYWKRSGGERSRTLQEVCPAHVAGAPADAPPDGEGTLQDLWHTQPPLVLGLVAHLTDVALQEDMAAVVGRLVAKGRAVLGAHTQAARSVSDAKSHQTSPVSGTSPPCPGAV